MYNTLTKRRADQLIQSIKFMYLRGSCLDWWGFEIALPLESVERLKTVRSIESAASQMLVALTAAGGAVELLPFIRFISAYLDMEWGAIKEQNKGNFIFFFAF